MNDTVVVMVYAAVSGPATCWREHARTTPQTTSSPREIAVSGGSVIPGKGNDMPKVADSGAVSRTTDGAYTLSRPRGTRGRADSRFGALTALFEGTHVLYAIRTPEGHIKIGCTKSIANRISGIGGEILAVQPGDFEDERGIHAGLVPFRAKGWEYYHPTPEVLSVVNELRTYFDLPPLAA